MLNFRYIMPTRVIFGRDTQARVGEEIASRGGHCVLVHYSSGGKWAAPLIDQVCASVEEAGLRCVRLGGVVPNPRLGKVREGIALCRREGVDFVLAVGGGSVIDSAKAIGYGAANEGDVWDFYIGKRKPNACLPVGVVLTIAASGSETSDGSVITNEEGWLKRDCGSDMARPRFAIMNPELTFSVPAYQTASGGADILMHAMERYFTRVAHVELSDGFCESLMRTVMHQLPAAIARPDDYDARAELMWAGSVCHNGLLTAGRKGDWASHNLQHELGGMFDVAHGAGLCAIWGSWARYVYRADTARFAQFAVNVAGCVMDYREPEKTALEGIEAMERFFARIGMPTSLRALGLHPTEAQLDLLADKCSMHGSRTIGAFLTLNRDDMRKIYEMAR